MLCWDKTKPTATAADMLTRHHFLHIQSKKYSHREMWNLKVVQIKKRNLAKTVFLTKEDQLYTRISKTLRLKQNKNMKIYLDTNAVTVFL